MAKRGFKAWSLEFRLLLVILVLVPVTAPALFAAGKTPTWFVFLVTGDSPPKATPEEISQYQAAHIGNFKAQFEAGKLVSAGPMRDPDKKMRGITVFCVKSKEAVTQCFLEDPYVQKGFMKLQAYPLRVEWGRLNTTGLDPEGIVENRIVLLEAADGNAKSEAAPDWEYWRKSDSGAGLAFACSLLDAGVLKGLAFFRDKDDPKIEEFLRNEPAIKSGRIRYKLMPQWFSRGVL